MPYRRCGAPTRGPAPPSDAARPLVVHAPSNREKKGTADLIEACAQLPVDLEIVEGVPHTEARERYARADIVVDQLNAGWHGVFALEAMRLAICNPTASLYNNRTQLHAALEFACLDIMGKKLGVPVHALLGGKLRDAVEFASYLFFRYPDPDTGDGEVRTAAELVAHAQAQVVELDGADIESQSGFTG